MIYSGEKPPEHCDTQTHDLKDETLKRVAVVKVILLSTLTTTYAIREIFSFVEESKNHPNSTPRFGQILHSCAQPVSPE